MLRPSVTTLAQYAVIIAPYRVNNLFYFPCFLVKRLLSEIFKVLAKGSIISFFFLIKQSIEINLNRILAKVKKFDYKLKLKQK